MSTAPSLETPVPGTLAAGASPAERHSTPVDGVEVVGALSPSRAGDFMTCPLLYRFRTIDKLPEPFQNGHGGREDERRIAT